MLYALKNSRNATVLEGGACGVQCPPEGSARHQQVYMLQVDLAEQELGRDSWISDLVRVIQ